MKQDGDLARRTPRVLSIAGTDPTGGAGIQADLKSIAANGGYGMAVVTALVAQNTRGVRSVHIPPAAFLREQLDAVSDDVVVDAVKIGMLATAEIIDTVTRWLDRVRPPIVVLDPVMVATSGDRLLDAEAEQAMRDLLRHADLITPNVPELGVLAEVEAATSWDDVLAQAGTVAAAHRVRVLAKGGHVAGDVVRDALVDVVDAVVTFEAPRIETTATHGTGCSLSSAVATRQVVANDWSVSVDHAKRWLTESLRHGDALHVGQGNGPISHFAGLWQRGGVETTDPRGVTDRWWERIDELRTAIDNCDFVRSLTDGSLARAAFEYYLAQDALYLRGYARVLSTLGATADDPRHQDFWAVGAHESLTEEMRLHTTWLAGIDLRTCDGGDSALLVPGPTTTAYLDHLLGTAARGNHAVTAAAVLPCYWLYGDLGERLVAAATDSHPYRDWLLTYADQSFAAAARRAVDVVGELAAAANDWTRRAMWQAFRTSAEHELAFFRAPLTRE